MNKWLGRRLTIFLMVAVLAAGCGDNSPEPTPSSPGSPQGASSDSADGLVLEGDGLGIVSFGEPEGPVVELLTDRLGPPTRDEVNPAYCRPPEGQRDVHWDTLRVGFKDGKFARYFYRQSFEDDLALSTARGVAPGSTLDEVKGAYGPELPPGPESLGTSYSLETESGPVGAFFQDVVPAPGTEKGVYALAAGGFCDA